jgi:polysaccharide pyruvyl transferase WcaK-like protein
MLYNYFFSENKKSSLKDYLINQLIESFFQIFKNSNSKKRNILDSSNVSSKINGREINVLISNEIEESDPRLVTFLDNLSSNDIRGHLTFGLSFLETFISSKAFENEKVNIFIPIGNDLFTLLKDKEEGKETARVKLEEIIELISKSLERRNITYFFQVTIENLYWVDDVYMLFSKMNLRNIIFHPSKSLIEKFTKNEDGVNIEKFHISLFFENLYRQKNSSLELRFFYKRIFELFQSKNIGLNPFYSQLLSNFKNITKVKSKQNLEQNIGFTLLIEELTQPSVFNVVKLISNSLKSKVTSKANNRIDFQGKINYRKIDPNVVPQKWESVLITGWYGTETQGDKAIIGEVLHFIKSASKNCKVYLTTLHFPISEQTNNELRDLRGVELIDLNKSNSAQLISKVDAVIIGGGPLMESASMRQLGNLFAEGFNQNKDLVIFGCGIGPIHNKEVEIITSFMLSVCNAGFVRDKESFDFASKLFPGHNLKFACDPAVGFVSRWRKENKVVYSPNGRQTIATLLRANTNEFSPESNPEKLRISNEILAQKVANSLDNIADKTGASYALLHMNAPWVGGDDRIYNRILASQLAPTTKINLVREYLTLEEHMKVLSSCNSALAMRYHGHIFCMAMGIPFLSLDYTGKSGKVSSLVNRIGYGQWSIKWDEIDTVSMPALYEKLMLDKVQWSAYLISEADKLVQLLHQTYQEVFNYCPEN